MKILELNKKINIYTWIAAMTLILVISTFFCVAFKRKNKIEYIYYNENGNIDYKVELIENKYFTEEYLEKDNQYIADLVGKIKVGFDYEMDIDYDIEYNYTYKIMANINIIDEATNKILYTSSDEIIPEKSENKKGKLKVLENIDINYSKYNDFAKEFVEVYKLKNSVSKLSIIMNINMEGMEQKEERTLSLDIPLNENTFSMNSTTNLIDDEKKYIEIMPETQKGTILIISAIVLFIFDIILLIGFVKYVRKSRTEEDIYNSKLKNILNKYESCISKVEEEFNMSDYRIIKMQTFDDLLEIRDTMRLPIMMVENKEKRMTCFMITTDNNVLYFFSIGVTQYALPAHCEKQENIKVD